MADKTQSIPEHLFAGLSDIDIEKSVLAALTLDKANAIQYSAKLSTNDFFNKKCAVYFLGIQHLLENDLNVDRISILGATKKSLARFDVWDIADHIDRDSSLKTHIQQLKSLTRKRDTISLCSKISNDILSGKLDDLKALSELNQTSEKILTDSVTIKRSKEEIAEEIRDELVATRKGDKKLYNLFGIPDIDQDVQIDFGDLVLIPGSSNVGKSWLLNTMACHFSDVYKWPTKIFSMEMSDKMVVRRMYSMFSGVAVSYTHLTLPTKA